MRRLTLLWCGNSLELSSLGKAEKRRCLPWLLDTRVSVCIHVLACAGASFLEVLKNIPFALLMRHILIRSFKLLARCSLQWLQHLVPKIN